MKAALLCLLLLSAPPLDRIVAVVDKRPILLSEIRLRERPVLLRMKSSGTPVTDATIVDVQRRLVDRIIDEHIIEQEARRYQIHVEPHEIDERIAALAAQAQVTPELIVAEALGVGMTRQQYRDEIRREIVEGKWLENAIRPRLREIPKDPKTYMERITTDRDTELLALRARHHIEVRR